MAEMVDMMELPPARPVVMFAFRVGGTTFIGIDLPDGYRAMLPVDHARALGAQLCAFASEIIAKSAADEGGN